MRIRRATSTDGQTLLALIRGLADYEKLEPPTEQAAQGVLDAAFGPNPRLEIWLAEDGGDAVGYAALFETFSTFVGKPTLYLEDLFVLPEARGKGIGSQMMKHLIALADERGAGRFEWLVLDWNVGAQRFYESLGATVLPDFRVVRMTL